MKILFLDSGNDSLKRNLENRDFVCDEDFYSSKSDIESIIYKYEGLIVRSRFKIDAFFLKKANNLKFIARIGAGLENIDIEFAKKQKIELISTPEGNSGAVGEHCLAMILNLFNKINISNNQIRDGKWIREANRGEELSGKIVGIIGYGNMGKSFAKKLKGFDLEVIFYDIKSGISDENARQVSLEELFEKTDILSIHTPLTELTHNMINFSFANKFHKNIYIINSARGNSLVVKDIVEHMKKGKVLGVCLDVLEYEKSSFESLFESEIPEEFEFLLNSEKAILTPHIAGWTHQSKQKMSDIAFEKIMRFYNKK